MATELYAPMVGKVINFLVEVGAEVEEDEPVLVLEALKMKMPVVSPCDGTLKEFCVAEGDEVESDTVLAIIDDA
jgi:acetyl-CoA carboxylase biotin carboxyl carrier protein